MKLYSNGNILQIYHNASQIQNLQKRNILLTDYNGGDTVVIILLYREGDIRNGNNTITLDYSDITVPATFTSGSDLNTWLVAALQDVLDEADNDGSNLIGKPSGGDFVTSYNGATSLDCDGMPTIHPVLIDEDLTEVWQINSAQEVINVFERDEVAMVVTNPAGTTYRITIATAAFAATDTFVVYTNVSSTSSTTVVLGTDTYTEGTTRANVIAVVRNDAGDSLVDTDGELTSLQVNATGQLGTNLESIRDAAVDIGSGNAGSGTQKVIIADDDVNLASINTDAGTIAGDTTSLDDKTPALGTAAMVASSPITIASDDTLTTAANTLLGTIDTDTSAMVIDLAAIEILNTDIKTATEASAVDLAAIEVLNTTIASDTTSIDTKLTDASQKSQIIDGSGNVIASTANALDVNLASSIGLTISATDLDIRDLVSTSDSVEVLQSTASSLNMTEASASGIKIDTGVIAGDTTSLDTKEGTTGEVADAEGTRAAQLRYIGEAVDALKAPITTVTTLVTEQDLTDTYADFGAELDMSGYTKLGIWVSTDCNDSEDVDLKVLGKHTSAGADEFAIDGVSVKRLWTGVGTDSKTYYEFAIGAIPYIQLQAIAGTLGVTAGDLTISITKVY